MPQVLRTMLDESEGFLRRYYLHYLRCYVIHVSMLPLLAALLLCQVQQKVVAGLLAPLPTMLYLTRTSAP